MIALTNPTFISVLAPVCSSWVFVSRSGTGRSQFEPLGNVEYLKVRAANLMVFRCVLLCAFVTAKGGTWLLENPVSSIIWRHPAFQWLLSWCRVWTFNLDLRRLGAGTKKPVVLYSKATESTSETPPRGTETIVSKAFSHKCYESLGKTHSYARNAMNPLGKRAVTLEML